MPPDAKFTTIDLNDTSTTSTIFDQSIARTVTGVYMRNGGSSAEVRLEVTDGTDTATLAVPGGGNNLSWEGTAQLAPDDDLQINVTTAEGSSQSNTAVAFIAE